MKARYPVYFSLPLCFLGPLATTTIFGSDGTTTLAFSTKTTIRQGLAARGKPTKRSLELWASSSDKEHIDEEEEEEEDEVTQTAYGSRSLAWTNQYRKLIPYEMARRQAIRYGVSSKEEWQEFLEVGKIRGPYMISRPDEMYQEEWVSWEEFLGVMRPYEETKQLVQSILQLKSMEEYQNFVKSNRPRAEGLRIPAKPDIFYRNKGWQGWEVFFGSNSASTK